MSAPKLIPPDTIRRLAGFGLTAEADSYLFQPRSNQEILAVFDLARSAGRQIVLRGAGRSYGDASIGTETLAIDLSELNRILSWDRATGLVEAEAGVTIEQLWRACLPDGWWPPVVSGTMFPTLAGALAMNIHGKNNPNAGTLGEHVEEIEVVFPNRSVKVLSPADELFGGVISGAGLFGVIVRVKLRMKKVASGMLRVLPISVDNWNHQFALFDENADADYCVSWVDCFARGGSAGRGQFHAARYPSGQDLESLGPEHQDLPPKVAGVLPKSEVWRILKRFNNRPGMCLLNASKYLSGKLIGNRKEYSQSLVAFSFLLDYVPDWRKAYLPGGFLQFQSFVPTVEARRIFAKQIEMQQAVGLEPFLGVLKRHRVDTFLLSHGVDGYSLALDFKVTEANRTALQGLCHSMNDLVLAAGGRFYFAKDSTLRPTDLPRYLGEETLARFRAHKGELDPDNLLTSELAKRVGLDSR